MWPNESPEYRKKRDELLIAESQLRKQHEKVASLRRELPTGGNPREDYTFTDVHSADQVNLSQLFEEGKNTLLVYNLMYKDADTQPCVMCASMLDGLNGAAPHVRDRVSFAIVAKASADKIAGLAKDRNWQNLRFLSSDSNSYNRDYGAETEDGSQMPMMHVWTKNGGDIKHFWGSELFYHKDPEWENHPRHLDNLWPVWNLFDLTPGGRDPNWYPKNAY